jgi:hypothetical protein
MGPCLTESCRRLWVEGGDHVRTLMSRDVGNEI